MSATRLHTEAGIAIGPILFVVAILGILAAAIAAGSGSFTSSTTQESARTRAAAIIQIGQNLKLGFDRITGLGTAIGSVVLDPTSTANDNDIFSPTGGGINPPSVTMSNDPGNDIWYYVNAAMPNMGTGSTEKLAMIRVAADVCTQVNSRANALTTPAAADVGNVPASGTLAGMANWPAALNAKPTGCVNINTTNSVGTWFYQVLGVQ
jgi:type II secretory pathway pseudopilin PulG